MLLTAEPTACFGLYTGWVQTAIRDRISLIFQRFLDTNYQWIKVDCLRFSGPRNHSPLLPALFAMMREAHRTWGSFSTGAPSRLTTRYDFPTNRDKPNR